MGIVQVGNYCLSSLRFVGYKGIQGTSLLFAHTTVALMWLAPSSSISRAALLLTAILEFCLFRISMAYVIAPIVRAYRPRWYRLVSAAIVALTAFVSAFA